MTNDTTYCVRRYLRNGGQSIMAQGISTLAEAAEIALRLTMLQERDLGGNADFTAEVE